MTFACFFSCDFLIVRHSNWCQQSLLFPSSPLFWLLIDLQQFAQSWKPHPLGQNPPLLLPPTKETLHSKQMGTETVKGPTTHAVSVRMVWPSSMSSIATRNRPCSKDSSTWNGTAIIASYRSAVYVILKSSFLCGLDGSSSCAHAPARVNHQSWDRPRQWFTYILLWGGKNEMMTLLLLPWHEDDNHHSPLSPWKQIVV